MDSMLGFDPGDEGDRPADQPAPRSGVGRGSVSHAPAPAGLGALFDFSIRSFLTPSLVRFLYGMTVVLGGVGTLVGMAAAVEEGRAAGYLAAALAPLSYLVLVLIARISAEAVMVLFRIEEHLRPVDDRDGGSR